MTKKQNPLGIDRRHSRRDMHANHIRRGSASAAGARDAVRITPTSERIIKATSVKRRKAMKVLADR